MTASVNTIAGQNAEIFNAYSLKRSMFSASALRYQSGAKKARHGTGVRPAANQDNSYSEILLVL